MQKLCDLEDFGADLLYNEWWWWLLFLYVTLLFLIWKLLNVSNLFLECEFLLSLTTFLPIRSLESCYFEVFTLTSIL